MCCGCRVFQVYLLVGAIIWGIGGWISAWVCFQPGLSVEEIQASPDEARAMFAAIADIQWKMVAIWGTAGAILGLLTMASFASKEPIEHAMPLPPPGGFGPPMSMAQMKTSCLMGFIGFLVGIPMAVYLTPHLLHGDIELKAVGARVFAGILAGIWNMSLLPLSLKVIGFMMAYHRYK